MVGPTHREAVSRVENALSLFVTDEELIARLGLPKGSRGTRVLVELTKQRNRAPFPKKDPLFLDRRYWPAVLQWLNDYFGVRDNAEAGRIGYAGPSVAPTKEPHDRLLGGAAGHNEARISAKDSQARGGNWRPVA